MNSNGLATNDDLLDWRRALIDSNYRGILLCSQQMLPQLKNQLKHLPPDRLLDCKGLTQQQAQHNLGKDFEYLLFELEDTKSRTNSFNVNLFCSVSGALSGGGIMIIVYPDAYTESSKPVALSPTKVIESLCISEDFPILLRRLLQSLDAEKSLRIYTGQKIGVQEGSSKSLPNNQNAVREQIKIIQTIKKVTTGHSRRPLVLTSDRGRGKSSAMGIAAAELILDAAKNIAVVAPSINNLNSFFFHAEKTLSDNDSLAQSHKTQLVSKSGGQIKFITASNLAQSESQPNRKFDTVMIDEAAAIPVSLLEQLNHKFNRIVYSTTCHGYEGNGQGFEIRFKQKLLSLRPQTRFESLKEPFRWALGDPLENALASTFLFDADIQPLDGSKLFKKAQEAETGVVSNCQFKVYSQQNLKQDKDLLASVFSLLVNAHYQTRPADLQAILLNPQMTVCGLELEGHLVAVALLNSEGDLNADQIKDVYSRKHLSNGHLLPQSLIANYGIQDAGKLSFLRIMRIAVHPQLKRQGIGSTLLKKISDNWQDKIDIIGTSFAASHDVVSFWCENEYEPVRIGSARDSSTGEVSVEFLLPLNPIGNKIADLVKQRFVAIFRFNFPTYANQLDLPSLLKIFLRTPALNCFLNDHEKDELRQFSKGHRSLTLIGDLLTRLVLTEKLSIDNQLTPKEFETLLFASLSQLPMTQLADELQFSGKKQLLIQLRQICGKLLNADPA